MFHVVDDNVMIGEVIVNLIRMFGHEALLFSCPAGYLNYMHKSEYLSPVAIFSDVKMPQMNGYDFMYQVQQVNPQQKFVMVTGTPELKHDCKHLACMYMSKPFAPDLLRKVTAELMRCQEENYFSSESWCNHLDNKVRFGLDGWTCPHGYGNKNYPPNG